MQTVFVPLLFICLINTSFPQDLKTSSLRASEERLAQLLRQIIAEESYSGKASLNETFNEQLLNALSLDGSFLYPFDSLKHVGKLASKDGRVKVYTWNIPHPAGKQSYFGVIQTRGPKGTSKLFPLVDSRNAIADPAAELLSPSRWLGALYYEIIDFDYQRQTSYLLLGVDINNLFTSKKIIEVLSIDDEVTPVFGAPVFRVDRNSICRIIFEYSARVSMTLKHIPEERMIVFDHLSPSRPDFAGNFQFYGPDFTFDAFKLEKEQWVYTRDIDIRNPKRTRPKPVDAPEKLPEPGFLYQSRSVVPSKIP